MSDRDWRRLWNREPATESSVWRCILAGHPIRIHTAFSLYMARSNEGMVVVVRSGEVPLLPQSHVL